MKDKKKWIIGISACVLLMVSVFFVFNQGKSNEQVVTEYFELLKKKNYKQMYQMLNTKTVYTPTQKYFVEKYKEFYEEIDAKNIQIKILDEQDNVIEYLIYIDTLAGRITYRNKVGVKNEQIQFNKELIMDGYTDGCKIKITTYNPEKRGRILDRNGKVLAEDGKGYSVGLVKGKLNGENDYGQIAQYLETDVETLQKKMSASWINDDSFVPIKTVSEATKNDLINKNILGINGVKISTVSIRTYPYDKVASHIVGYVQNVNAEDLKKHKNEGYNSISVIGRSGIEAAYEEKLRGITSGKIDLVDKNDKVIKELCHKEVKMSPQDITLTIDIDLQQSLYNEYQNDKSASVALNPKTGEVLALVSTPSYSNNDFVLGLSTDKWNALNNDVNQPLMSRYKQTYTPGSSMKPITAAIGLETKAIDPDKDLGAKDKWQKDSSWGNYYVTTLHAPSPNNLKNAITYSDNVYFARSALNIGKENLFKYYKNLKIGKKVPFELALNKSQYINKNQKVSDQLIADSGYGQGQILINPLQLASIYSAFVNNGSIYQPHIVQGQTKIWIKNVFSKETTKIIKEDLINAIADENGTGHAIYHDNVILAGKTGTAEIKQSQSDTTGTELGWFTVMTIDEKQPILMTTVVEDVKNRGGSGYVVEHTKAPLDLYLPQVSD
ncbi:penicillin-binding transpeptidase domain-containing protein [Coprobacillus sp. AM29-13]|jgi:penicillin-binding protein 3|uniref:penicillin-binding transpeptidase domain-containing protein n=1 Tax=Faecalibacillus intestinalis TaxID=1982626 RepID=UPI000E470598|nr:penicillin-binding transpeptidase domain-containing protein [Faecalibacillus intestinalis]RGF61395.1 penicillin-binding transpeptidase domain-containing protein [Coprobacillus sp. AF36-10BH]RGI00701.1 penicillin-binding transpeptidase domain-containing protein [Coprobacillus sp. AM26-5AC]RHP77715.1 penicillin-binding transpeptidase domain-containing protein [Coprobacillus sp. OF03-2AA]RHR16029.1 penicillin-binding transpeptidase domain-containing protein [Coprobacillus sp. AF19-3]RHR88278.1